MSTDFSESMALTTSESADSSATLIQRVRELQAELVRTEQRSFDRTTEFARSTEQLQQRFLIAINAHTITSAALDTMRKEKEAITHELRAVVIEQKKELNSLERKLRESEQAIEVGKKQIKSLETRLDLRRKDLIESHEVLQQKSEQLSLFRIQTKQVKSALEALNAENCEKDIKIDTLLKHNRISISHANIRTELMLRLAHLDSRLLQWQISRSWREILKNQADQLLASLQFLNSSTSKN
jgi:hypothetical protein